MHILQIGQKSDIGGIFNSNNEQKRRIGSGKFESRIPDSIPGDNRVDLHGLMV
jgi:hypothetical protein